MKIWIKLFAAAVIGILLGLFLPDTGGTTATVFAYLAELIIKVGRYLLFPLVFFSLAHGVYELQLEKKISAVYLRTILYMVLSSAVAVIFGIAVILLLSPSRVQIIIKQQEIISTPSVKAVLDSIFPTNLFEIFSLSGDYLLPISFFAFFLGANLSFERTITRPILQLLESLSKTFEHMNSFITEIISIASIILAADLTFRIKSAEELSLFIQFLVIISVLVLILVIGVYPVLFYLFSRKSNPYKWLYGQIGPALTGLISGDSYFSTMMLFRHGRENLGIPRKVGSSTFTLFALFGKAGTALITAVSFMIIIKSYSSLGITMTQILWVAFYSFLVSFLAGPFPGSGILITLSLLCRMYGRGLEDGFLILQPILPVLISLSVFLDIVTASLVSVLVTKHSGLLEDIYRENLI